MKAIFELSDHELVLIDTEAHSPWNPEEVDEVFLALDGPGIEFQLVLPSTWDKGDIIDACESYDYQIDGLILTHLEKRSDDNFVTNIDNLISLNTTHGLSRDHIQSVSEMNQRQTTSAGQELSQPGNNCLPEKNENKNANDFSYLKF